KKLEREQIDWNDHEHRANEAKRQGCALPGDGADAAQHTVHRRNSQWMKWMIDRVLQTIAPGARLDLLGLANVAEAVGEAGLRMAKHPPQEGSGQTHEQPGASGVLQLGHSAVLSAFQDRGEGVRSGCLRTGVMNPECDHRRRLSAPSGSVIVAATDAGAQR